MSRARRTRFNDAIMIHRVPPSFRFAEGNETNKRFFRRMKNFQLRN